MIARRAHVASDALADVIVDIDPIDAVNDLEAAMALVCRWCTCIGIECGGARGSAQGRLREGERRADVVEAQVLDDRGVAAAMENRAVRWTGIHAPRR
jgi:hypothetical protein